MAEETEPVLVKYLGPEAEATIVDGKSTWDVVAGEEFEMSHEAAYGTKTVSGYLLLTDRFVLVDRPAKKASAKADPKKES